jgi:hypothetical protein
MCACYNPYCLGGEKPKKPEEEKMATAGTSDYKHTQIVPMSAGLSKPPSTAGTGLRTIMIQKSTMLPLKGFYTGENHRR